MGYEPSDVRDLMKGQEKPLIKAAQDLARAVEALEDADPDHLYGQAPLTLIVGGFVRDALLGLHPKDADVEVFGVAPERLVELLEQMFGKPKEAGKAFGVMKVQIGDGLELDVSIPRRESKAGKGHTGFLVDSDPSLTIRDAARRRDFTVNALSMDPITGVIYDPFGGEEDLRAKTLRVTDPAKFVEDPLRVLRAVQFVARLGFTVDPESTRLMREMVARGELSELPRERIAGELEKLLFKGERPSEGLRFARDVGALEVLFPGAEIADWDAWTARVDAAAATGLRHVTLAAFFSGFSAAKRDAVLHSLRLSEKQDVQPVRALLCEAERVETSPTNLVNDARLMLKRTAPATPEDYAAWLTVLGRGAEAQEFLSLVREKWLTADPLLQGRDLITELGLADTKKNGPLFGKVLRAVELARDAGTIKTREEAIGLARTLL